MEHNSTKTILSAGRIIYDLLSNDQGVMAIATDVFPIIDTQEATLPYVVYRRTDLTAEPTKGSSAFSANIECWCFGETYAQSVELAEAVKACLDGSEATVDGVHMRKCRLVNGSEEWVGDAYNQVLNFNVKIY